MIIGGHALKIFFTALSVHDQPTHPAAASKAG